MSDLNLCQFIGRLGRDPEMRYMPSGDAIANFSLAVGEKWKDKASGEMREETEWVKVSIFGKLAEIAGEYLKKGAQVYIAGKLRTRKWQDKEGQDRYTTEVVVNGMNGTGFQMLGSKGGGGGSGGEQAPRKPAAAPSGGANPQGNQSGFEDMDDDIPF